MADNRAKSLSPFVWALRCADALAVGSAGLLAHYLRFGVVLPEDNYALAYPVSYTHLTLPTKA